MEISGVYSFLAASLGSLLTVKLYESNKKQKIKNSNINMDSSNKNFEKIHNLEQVILIAKQRKIDHLLDQEEWKAWHIRKKIKK